MDCNNSVHMRWIVITLFTWGGYWEQEEEEVSEADGGGQEWEGEGGDGALQAAADHRRQDGCAHRVRSFPKIVKITDFFASGVGFPLDPEIF